jgi:hypothetical protein
MNQQYPPNPQFQQQLNPNQPQHTAPKKKHTTRTVLIVIGSVVGGLILIGALAGGNDPKPSGEPLPGTVTTKTTPKPATTAPPKITAPKPTTAPKATQPSLTKGQEQAIGSAESYLAFTAFSRKGLIHQLSSDAGEGFSVADATYAVDHIKVDWNEQAAKAAKSYLEMTHFSRQGLIHQLESSAGDGFTHRQAVYGVTKAGL